VLKNDVWRFVIVGCGRMGEAHAHLLQEDKRAHVIGFFDESESTAIRLRDQCSSDATVFGSFEEALASDSDAVVIATPTGCHHDQIAVALSAGRHVLAEKPLAQGRQEIVNLIRMTESHPQLHCVLGYQRRFWKNHRFLRDEVQSGKWGKVRSVTFVNNEHWEAGIGRTWRDDPSMNFGGFLGDAGSHKIDALMYITGRQPDRLFAMTQNSGSRVEIIASVTGTLDGGIPLTLAFTGNAHSYYEELLIHCDDADLILRDDRVLIARENVVEPVELPIDQSGPLSTANPVSGLLDILSGVATNPSPFLCALPVFDVTAAILRSARDGQSLRLK